VLQPALSQHQSYIFDLWIDFSDPDLKMLLVELNPFHIGAGAGLFSWRQDRELFLHGPSEGGFELRMALKTEEDPYAILPGRWRTFIEEVQTARRKPSCVLM
jgi:hypothetical protein